MSDVVDWSVLQRLAEEMEDDEIVEIVVSAYRSEVPARRAALLAAQDGTPEAMAEAAHALKSASESVGAMALGQLCREAELAARAGDLDTARARGSAAVAMLDEVDAALAHGSNR